VIFAHEDREFEDLLQITAAERRLAVGLVEKDYWVTHTLWALHDLGFDVRFKGGTSLSKGFGLIERFSEDLDLKIEPGTVRDLPGVSNWKGDGTKATLELEAYRDNRPRAVHCVHPLVTLLEKLEAIGRRFPNDHDEPAKFVRHFEDAARIIDAMKELPKLKDYDDVSGLVADMRAKKDLKASPRADDPAFAPRESQRWDDIRTAHVEIAPMFWGPRISLDDACAKIRAWITTSKVTPAGG
jgi:hypothetical protein